MALAGPLLMPAAPARPEAGGLVVRRLGPDHVPEQTAHFRYGQWQEIGVETPCCMGRRCGRIEPYPCSGSFSVSARRLRIDQDRQDRVVRHGEIEIEQLEDGLEDGADQPFGLARVAMP